MFKKLLILAGLVGLAASLSAQTSLYPDTFKVSYYSHANTSNCVGATVRITNVGTQLGSKTNPSGDLWAAIYVLSPDQQLAECCACRITPDGLLKLDVNTDLTSNPLTPVILTTGDIKIVSSSSASPKSVVPAAGIRAWGTHDQDYYYGNNFETETPFTDSNLSPGELKELQSKCSSILNNGSGYGVCSCGGSTN